MVENEIKKILGKIFIAKNEYRAKLYTAFWVLLAFSIGGFCDWVISNTQQYIAQYVLYQAAVIAGIPGVSQPTLPATSGYFSEWWGTIWNATWLGLLWFSLLMAVWFAFQAGFKSYNARGLFLASMLCFGMALWSVVFSYFVYTYWYDANFFDFVNATVDWLPPGMAGLTVYDFSGNPVNKIAFSYGFGGAVVFILILGGAVMLYYAWKFEKLKKRIGVENR